MRDGAECVGATIFTRAWNAEAAPGSSAGRFLVLRFDRKDQKETVPIFCNEDDVFCLLREIVPPVVHIRAVPGEDVGDLESLVESSCAPLH